MRNAPLPLRGAASGAGLVGGSAFRAVAVGFRPDSAPELAGTSGTADACVGCPALASEHGRA